MKYLFSALIASVFWLSGTQAMAQAYMFVDLQPYRQSTLNPTKLVSNFGALEDYGFDSFWVRMGGFGQSLIHAPRRIVPVIEEVTSTGTRLRKLNAAPLTDVGRRNPCLGALFCAFSLSADDLKAIRAGGEIKVLLHDSYDVPEHYSELGHIRYFSARGCKVNAICPLTTSRLQNFTGEIIIQDMPKGTCIASNSGYTRALYSSIGTLNKRLAVSNANQNYKGLLNAPAINISLPVVVAPDTDTVRMEPEMTAHIDNWVYCIRPETLAGYFTIINQARNKEALLLVSAIAFKMIEQENSFTLKVKVRRKERATVDKLKTISKDRGSKVRYEEHEATVDLGDLVSMLQDSYESSAEILIEINAIENLQAAIIDNKASPGNAWAAQPVLPGNRSLCRRLVEQMGLMRRFTFLPSACQ